MYKKIIKTLLAIALCTSATTAMAQETVNSEHSSSIAVGSMNRLDTYLSPLRYYGTDVRYIYNSLKVNDSQWDRQFTHEGSVDITHNDYDNANALAAHYDFGFAMMHRWQLADNKLILRLGGMTELYAGFAYNTRNSANNPAQAYVSLSLGAQGMATYNLKIGNKNYPVTLDARCPLVGGMFSPAYGQSYYEIFNRGNYDHNIVFYNVSTPTVRYQLSVDIPVGRSTAIKVGYLGDIRQAEPNNLRQHTYTHAAVLGLTKKL